MRKSNIPALALLLTLGLGSPSEAGWEEGVAAFNAGKYQDALTQFQGVTEGQPDWPGGHLMVGQVLVKLNRPAEAERALRKSYDLNPNDANTQLVLGQVYVSLKRYREAAELLESVKVEDLSKAQQGAFYHLRGTARQKSGKSDSAIADLRRAAQMNPDDSGLQYQLGTVLLSLNDTEAALGPLQKAASLDPSKRKVYTQTLLRSGRENKGQAKINAYKKASAQAEQLAADGSYDNILLLGEAQLGAKNYSSAAENFRKASAKKPGDWLPNLYLGQAYTALGQYDKAGPPLNTALGQVDTDKDKKRIQRQLGFILEKQKKFEQAIAFYNQAGDAGSVARVESNRDTAASNLEADKEKEEYDRLMKEEEELKKALEELPGG